MRLLLPFPGKPLFLWEITKMDCNDNCWPRVIEAGLTNVIEYILIVQAVPVLMDS